ncbi:MAG: transmembrane anchor protein [Gammaproteobacteria bacterium]|nr:transmembrane anchor protein [Gammaproteobacteria bacterium]
MYNSNNPEDSELPSTGRLIKSTILAAVAAGVLLVTVVMPAEYGIDPTGIGNAIGLKKMGDIKVSLSEEVAADKSNNIAVKDDDEPAQAEVAVTQNLELADTTSTILNHEMQVTLAPDESTEIKVKMSKNNKVQYTWWTDSGKAFFDLHGDSKKQNINYHSYEKGTEQQKEGEIIAAFDGSHGWYWRNRTSKTITITIKTRGEYTGIRRLM